jgi:hypothetical protein
MINKNTGNSPTSPNTTPSPSTNELSGLKLQGHIKIYDPVSKEVFVDKRNAIHYENFSIALAQSISNQGEGTIGEMVFGNGGTRVDPTGIITYLTPNSFGLGAKLYNQTYTKIVDGKDPNSPDPSRNFMEVRHVTGMPYTDILVSCLLDFGEPSDQFAFDNSTNQDESYVFDELGLRTYNPNGEGMLITHVIFHPVQKSLNRMIQIEYTVRIQSLSNM